MTAYIDVNGNGRLDPFVEPSAWCQGGDRWRCEISRETVTVHRTDSYSPGYAEPVTAVHVYVERYLKDWRPDQTFSACSKDSEQCAEEQSLSFIDVKAAQVKVLNACQHDWSMPLGLLARNANGEEIASHQIEEPQGFGIDFETQGREDGGLDVRGSLGMPAHRLIVWVGQGDHEVPGIAWTTEIGGNSLALTEAGYAATIPKSALAGCEDRCVIGVQALHRQQSEGVIAISEGRVIARL